MNDFNRKHFLRRFEFWIVIVACLVATVLLGLGGCAARDDLGARGARPEPSSVLRSFRVGAYVEVTEFRDSSGRVCVLARYPLYGIALDCGRPLPPLDYEQLPEPAVTPIPRSDGLEKRPL
jgi:hypothetical protein